MCAQSYQFLFALMTNKLEFFMDFNTKIEITQLSDPWCLHQGFGSWVPLCVDGADDESERVFLRDCSLTIELFGHYSPSLRINVGQELRKLSIIVNWKLRLLEFYWILLWEKKISPNNSLDASARHWWHLVTTFFQCVSLIDVSKYCQDKFSSA